MCWELTIAAVDPEYVPAEPAREALVRFLRAVEPGADDIRCEVYPAPVFWADWWARSGCGWAEVFCPICNTRLTEWFDGLRLPRQGWPDPQAVGLEATLPCCGADQRLPDLDFAGEKRGFARFFAVIDEPDRLDADAHSPLGDDLRQGERLAGCRLVEFVSDVH
jgi:hypothetical protein